MSSRKKTEALAVALCNGDLSTAKKLMSAGVDINLKVNGSTPLNSVVRSRSSLPGFYWLIENGANVDLADEDGLTPLMVACGRSGTKAVEMALALIRKGCDVTIRRADDGMSAIEFAAKNSDPQVLRLLVERGALIDGEPSSDLFPALLATRAGNLENLIALAELGCNLKRTTHLPWAKGMTCLEVARLEKQSKIIKYLEGIQNVNVRESKS